MTESTNRRQFVRLDAKDLTAKIKRQDDTEISAICKDLSGMGAMIEIDSTLDIGELLDIDIIAGRSDMRIKAKVTRQQDNNDSEKNIYGVQVLEIS